MALICDPTLQSSDPQSLPLSTSHTPSQESPCPKSPQGQGTKQLRPPLYNHDYSGKCPEKAIREQAYINYLEGPNTTEPSLLSQEDQEAKLSGQGGFFYVQPHV